MSRTPASLAEGVRLADAYVAATRAYADFCAASFDEFTDAEWYAANSVLRTAAHDARDELAAHVAAHGPVDTGSGTYRLDDDGMPAFRLHVFDHLGAISCN